MIASVFKLFKSKAARDMAPIEVGASLDQARALNQQGQFDPATAICLAILENQSDHIESLELLAEMAAKTGNRQQAIQWYDKVIHVKPGHAVAYYRRGNQFKDNGEFEAAAASYDQAIALDPSYANAFCNRGVVLGNLNRLDEALASYSQAIVLNPQDALAYYNRGAVLRELERPDEALASCEQAIVVKPDYAEAYCNRGILLQELKRSDEALASYDQAIALNPGLLQVYLNRASLLQERNQIGEALANCDRAIEIAPDSADGHFRRGLLLKVLKQWDAAVASFDRAIALKQDLAEAHCNRATALIKLNDFSSAIVSYDRGFALNPDLRFLQGLRLHAKMYLCEWQDFESGVARLITGIEAGAPVSLPFHALSLLDSALLHQKVAQCWTREEYPEDSSLPPIAKHPGHDRIRVGYFSADFNEHVVALITAELIENHDRSKFEVIAFSSGPDTGDAVRKRMERAFDRFIDVSESAPRDVALLARSLGIDIAVDLGGHTQGGATAVFALRAAPIQVNYLGYPGTMGAAYMDYIICDRTVIPESQQHCYTEKVVYLPNSYLPYESRREISNRTITREELGLPPRGFVFCCFNNSYKITPRTFDSWMRILGRVENSVLWLSHSFTSIAGNLRKEAASRGIDAERLIFASRVPSLQLHLARHRLADLFLDTLPFNAHSTAMDALWVGLPVLTCVGQAFAGRVAASLLNTIKLPELITSTFDEYEELAVDLATNPGRLADIRRRLLQGRLDTPLFDMQSFTKHLETAYARIFERHQAGLSPVPIELDR
jgi:predicted O-linked N-acetylglucosamine transferase (SPINDLY family)